MDTGHGHISTAEDKINCPEIASASIMTRHAAGHWSCSSHIPHHNTPLLGWGPSLPPPHSVCSNCDRVARGPVPCLPALQREVLVVFGDIPRCAHVISFAALLSSMRSVWKLTLDNIFIYFTEINETDGLHLRQTVTLARDG